MGIAKLAAIGMITLTTMTQTGWAQGAGSIGEATRVQQATGTRWLDINFKGGTLSDLVQAIKKEQPRANIILVGDVGELKIPPFEVFGVSPAGAMWVAKSVADADWNVQIEIIDPQDGSAATTYIRLNPHEHEAMSWMAPSKAWNLNSWIGGDPERIDATFAVIQVGLESFDSSGVTLKFHQPTGVLMARGNQAQIEFIDSVIRAAAEMPRELNALPQNVVMANEVIAKSSRRIAEIEGEVAVLAARADVFDARIIGLVEDKASEEAIAIQRVERAEILARINNLRFEEATLREAVEKAKKTVADYEAKNKR